MHQQFVSLFGLLFLEAGQGGHLFQQAVQVGIVRKGRLQQAAEVVHGRGNAGDELGLPFKEAPKTVGTQHLQGAEQHKQAQAAVEMGFVHRLIGTQGLQIGLQQSFLGAIREAGACLPDERGYVVINGAAPAALEVDNPRLPVFDQDVPCLEVPVHECVAIFCEQVCLQVLKIVLQAFFVEFQSGGFEETVFEIIEVEVDHTLVKGGVQAPAPVQAFRALKLQAGELFQRPAEQLSLLLAVGAAFASRGHQVKETGAAQIFLQITHLVLAHGHYRGNRQALLPKMA